MAFALKYYDTSLLLSSIVTLTARKVPASPCTDTAQLAVDVVVEKQEQTLAALHSR